MSDATNAVAVRGNRLIDLTGRRFGRLSVIARSSDQHRMVRWACRCDCGTSTVIQGGNLRSGHTRSCGCLEAENRATHLAAYHQRLRTHGQSRTRLYGIWRAMLKRCQNPRAANWSNYGGRGITVCAEWQTFSRFASDMGQPPSGHSLDRIDVDGNYCPGNCRWASASVQQRNQRDTRRFTFNGLALDLASWGERIEIAPGTLRARLRNGWSLAETLETPLLPGGKKQ